MKSAGGSRQPALKPCSKEAELRALGFRVLGFRVLGFRVLGYS